jgi:hypothetical protein
MYGRAQIRPIFQGFRLQVPEREGERLVIECARHLIFGVRLRSLSATCERVTAVASLAA